MFYVFILISSLVFWAYCEIRQRKDDRMAVEAEELEEYLSEWEDTLREEIVSYE